MTVSSTRNAWIHPASHCAGDTDSAAAPPMGLRLRLNAGYDISSFNRRRPRDRRRPEALRRIIADNGSNFYISGTSDKRWTDENLNQLKDIPGNQLRGRALGRPGPRLLSALARPLPPSPPGAPARS